MIGRAITIEEGLCITVICMIIVFIAILILAIILRVLKNTPLKYEQKRKIEGNQRQCKEEIDFYPEDTLTNLITEDDLVAAMAASIIASEDNRECKIRIKSIKRIK